MSSDKSYDKSNNSKSELIKNIKKNTSNEDIVSLNGSIYENDLTEFRKYNLFQTKKYSNGTNIYGLVHIKLFFFEKNKNNYNNYENLLIKKINNAIKISDKNNKIKGKFYVYLDLENVTIRNLSRIFLNKIANTLTKLYEDQLINYFINCNKHLIKMLWPIIVVFLDNTTKKKIIFC
tara:strand:- start:291 stop:821 length:531 start_codon:yes stop_codon:yes gene_type:complete